MGVHCEEMSYFLARTGNGSERDATQDFSEGVKTRPLLVHVWWASLPALCPAPRETKQRVAPRAFCSLRSSRCWLSRTRYLRLSPTKPRPKIVFLRLAFSVLPGETPV